MTERKEYYIFSGEGFSGSWEKTRPITLIGLKRRLTAERRYGDRWASAWVYVGSTEDGIIVDEIVHDDGQEGYDRKEIRI